jgi:hypothetical protein
MEFKKLEVDVISKLPNIDGFYEELYNLAMYKKEPSWNFFIKKKTLVGHLQDIRDDIENAGLEETDELKEKVKFMQELADNMEHELVMVDHDDLKY